METFKFEELQTGSLEFLSRFAGSMTTSEPASFWVWLHQRCQREEARRVSDGPGDTAEFPRLTARDASLVRNEMAILAMKIERSTDDVFVGLVAELGLKASAQLQERDGELI